MEITSLHLPPLDQQHSQIPTNDVISTPEKVNQVLSFFISILFTNIFSCYNMFQQFCIHSMVWKENRHLALYPQYTMMMRKYGLTFISTVCYDKKIWTALYPQCAMMTIKQSPLFFCFLLVVFSLESVTFPRFQESALINQINDMSILWPIFGLTNFAHIMYKWLAP